MSKSFAMLGAAALSLFALGGMPAQAQTSVYRTVEAASGKPTRLRVVTSLKKDCSLGSTAEIKVMTTPKNGDLVVKNDKMKTPANFHCPNVETPVQVVTYQSKAKYVGQDEVAIQVKNADGATQSINVKINVSDKPAAPKKEDGADL